MPREQLTPFVTAEATRNVQVSQSAYKAPAKTISGEAYLQMWKEHGGNDVVDVYENFDGAQKKKMPEVWEEQGEKPKD